MRTTLRNLLFLASAPYVLTAWTSVSHAQDSIRIGGMICLTGECAEVGENSRRGLELALKEINAGGGVLGKRVEIKYEDTHEMEGAARAVTAYQNLVTDPSIRYLIGPTWTVGGLPVAPILAKRPDIIAISPSLGVSSFNEAADTIFNTWPHDDASSETLAEYALKRGWKSAAILSNQNPWESVQAQHFRETYERLGGKVVVFLEPLSEVKDLRTEISRIKRAKADLLFMSNYTNLDISGKELRTQQVTIPMMSILLDDIRLKNSDGSLEGLLYVQYPPAQPDFIERFKANFGEEPGMSADTAYDALKMVTMAMEQAGSTSTAEVKVKLRALRYRGASGEIEFDKDGGVRKAPDIYVVKDGKRTRLGSAKELLSR